MENCYRCRKRWGVGVHHPNQRTNHGLKCLCDTCMKAHHQEEEDAPVQPKPTERTLPRASIMVIQLPDPVEVVAEPIPEPEPIQLPVPVQQQTIKAKRHKRRPTDPYRTPIQDRIRQQMYRSKGSLTSAEWADVVRSQRGCCAACGRSRPLVIDHVIPVSEGGSTSKENVQGLCEYCNTMKGGQRISSDFDAA